MPKKVKCPSWGCNGVGIPVETKKKYSFSKGAMGSTIGAIVGGAPGIVVGSMMGVDGKKGKTKFVCSKCGKVFEKKI